MRPVPYLLLLSLLPSALAFGQPAADEPAFTFEPSAVTVSGVAPDTPVVVFYVGRQGVDGVVRVVHGQEVVTADAAGQGHLSLENGVPPASLWAAVELASGAFSVAAPEGQPLREATLAADGLRADGQGRYHLLRDFREDLEVLYVRPGLGAWALSLRDGVGTDRDGREDGALSLSLDDLRGLRDGPGPPSQFAAGDVLIALDADRLEFFAFRLKP